MADEDLIKIVMDVLGTEKVEAAKKTIEAEQEAIRKLAVELKAAAISQGQFDAASIASAAKIKQATADIAAGTKAGFNPQALLEFSRAAEDAQYGVAGVVNNIPGLVAALGGSAGAAGAASLLAILLSQLVNHWGEFSSLIGYGGTFKPPIDGLTRMQEELKKARDEMEKLGKKTNLTWIELAKFKGAESRVKVLTENIKDQQAVDSSLEGGSEDDEKRAAGFKKALRETDGKIARNDYKAALNDQKDAKGQVYNFKREANSSVEDALRENWAAALEGNQRAIKSIGDALPEGNQFRGNIAKFNPKQVERDKVADAGRKEDAQLLQERIREAERAADEKSRTYERRAGDLAKPLQDAFNTSRASGTVVNEGRVRGKLEEAGVGADEAKRMAGAVLERLDQGFREVIRERAGKLGTDTEGAKGSILADAAAGAERDRDAAKRILDMDKPKAAEIFNGPAAIRDAIQMSVGKDDTAARSLAVQQQARDALNRSNELLLQIARTRQVARFGPARCG